MTIDPVSIAALISSLVITAAKTAIGCHGLSDKYHDAPRTLAHLEFECKTTRAALSVVCGFLLDHATALAPRLAAPSSPLADLVDLSLTGCTATFGVLDGEIERVRSWERRKHNDMGRRSKARVVWNQAELEVLLQRMGDVKSTLQLLLSALNTESLHVVQQLIAQQDNIVQSVRHSISIASAFDGESVSIFSSSCISETAFAFDDEIINTKVYRNAMRSVTLKRRRDELASKRKENYVPEEPTHVDTSATDCKPEAAEPAINATSSGPEAHVATSPSVHSPLSEYRPWVGVENLLAGLEQEELNEKETDIPLSSPSSSNDVLSVPPSSLGEGHELPLPSVCKDPALVYNIGPLKSDLRDYASDSPHAMTDTGHESRTSTPRALNVAILGVNPSERLEGAEERGNKWESSNRRRVNPTVVLTANVASALDRQDSYAPLKSKNRRATTIHVTVAEAATEYWITKPDIGSGEDKERRRHKRSSRIKKSRSRKTHEEIMNILELPEMPDSNKVSRTRSESKERITRKALEKIAREGSDGPERSRRPTVTTSSRREQPAEDASPIFWGAESLERRKSKSATTSHLVDQTSSMPEVIDDMNMYREERRKHRHVSRSTRTRTRTAQERNESTEAVVDALGRTFPEEPISTINDPPSDQTNTSFANPDLLRTVEDAIRRFILPEIETCVQIEQSVTPHTI